MATSDERKRAASRRAELKSARTEARRMSRAKPEPPAPEDVPGVMHNGLRYRLPFASLFRPHTAEEREDLVASIRELGVLARVVTYDSDRWGRRCVIDGATRLQIAATVGRDMIPVQHKADITDDQAREMAVSLNVDRRHLSEAELAAFRATRNRAIMAARVEDGDSLRVIGDRFGLNANTVMHILKAAGVSAASAREKVRGKDGRHYPAVATARPAPAGRALESCRRTVAVLLDQFDKLLAGDHGNRLRQILARHHADPLRFGSELATLNAALADLAAELAQPPDRANP